MCAKKYRTKIQLLLLALIHAALKRYNSAVKGIDSPTDQNGLARLGIANQYGLALLGAGDI